MELVKRAASENRGTDRGIFLAELAAEIEADRQALRDVMAELEVSPDRLKIAAGWLGEKGGRLKLNGQLIGYSPLSALVELEVLALGIHGKLGLWRALLELEDERVSEARLAELVARAESQRDQVEAYRLEAARIALGS